MKELTNFTKHFIVDVSQGSKHTSKNFRQKTNSENYKFPSLKMTPNWKILLRRFPDECNELFFDFINWPSYHVFIYNNPAGIYLLKISHGNKIICEICSKLTIKTPERCQWHSSGIFNVNSEQILLIILVLSLLILNK